MSRLSRADVVSRITPLAVRRLPWLPAGAQLAREDSLASLGLDSVGAVDLLLAVEQEFDLIVPDSILASDLFASVDALASGILAAELTLDE